MIKNATVYDDIDRFLSLKKLIFAGASSQKPGPANAILRKLASAGFEVTPLHPTAVQIDGHACASEIPPGTEGVFIFTHPRNTREIVDAGIAAGVSMIWMHNMLGTCTQTGKSLSAKMTSVDREAAEKAREAGIIVITGSCPMQHLKPVDPFHRCLRWFNDKAGNMG